MVIFPDGDSILENRKTNTGSESILENRKINTGSADDSSMKNLLGLNPQNI